MKLNRPWHQSDVNNYLTCPTLFYLRNVLELPEVGRHPNAVTGSALHWAIELWHNENAPIWTREKTDKFVRDLFADTIAGKDPMTVMHSTGCLPPIEWSWSKKSQEQLLEEAQEIFFQYSGDPANIEADILASEIFFRFKYWGVEFEGSMDQVRSYPDGSIDLVDFKYSSFSPHREFLKRAVQFTIYSYALWRGDLFPTDDDGKPIEEKVYRLSLLPDHCVWFHLPHLLPLKRASNGRQKGELRGDPLYPVPMQRERVLAEMRNIRKIISLANAKKFHRAGKQAGSCNGFCHYHDACANIIDDLPITTVREAVAKDFEDMFATI